MTLNSYATYPSLRTYVLKLHRDAMPADGRIFGRLESLSSGEHFDFGSAEEIARPAGAARGADRSEPNRAGVKHGRA